MVKMKPTQRIYVLMYLPPETPFDKLRARGDSYNSSALMLYRLTCF